MKYILSLGLLFLFSSLSAFETYYHAVKAQKGDGIYSLLRRYQLNEHDCNRQRFLELNNLTINDNLKVGSKYQLPVLIYPYNGKSIRSTVGIDNFDQAVRIKTYNEEILTARLRKTNFEVSKILWVPYHELHCTQPKNTKQVASTPAKQADKKPAKGNFTTIPLFGEKNKMVEIEDKKLKGKVYYIVSGHGGPDPGAMCHKECSNELCEDEYAYDVCLRLYRELISHGATVHMIIQDKNDGIRETEYLVCDKDETCMGSRIYAKQKPRLTQRASAINSLYKKYKKQGIKDQIALMVHVDSNTKDKRQDVYFYHHKTSKGSKKLAQSLQTTFKAKYDYHQKGRGYKGFVRARGLYMLNNTLPTAAYVELANIRNPNDQQRIILPSNRELLAQWLFKGITDYQGMKL